MSDCGRYMRYVLVWGLICAAGPRVAQAQALGDVFIANLSGNDVARFSAESGAYLGSFVAPGAGGLKAATGLAFGPDGHLYVGSSGTNQVLRFDGTSGTFLDAFVDDPVLTQPFSLIFGPDRDLYVSSGAQNVVLHFDGRTGAFVDTAAAGFGLRTPIGLTFGPNGLLYVANAGAHRVVAFDPRSREARGEWTGEGMRFPSDLAFGPDGSLYVTSAFGRALMRIQVEGSGGVETVARFPEGSAPVGIVFGEEGRIYVGDYAKGRLYRVDPGSMDPVLLSEEGLRGPENLTRRPGGR